MAKTKKRKSDLKICDDLRSKLIKIRAGFKCEYCGATKYLNAHHIFTRNNYSTRYDLDNGICLCSKHHTLDSNFSAHKTPMEFSEWIIGERWEDRYQDLKFKTKQLRDKDYDRVEKYLIEETNKLIS